jgi:protein gp37
MTLRFLTSMLAVFLFVSWVVGGECPRDGPITGRICMTIQFKPNTGGRGIEWTDATRNATGGCMHDCRWQMPDGTVAICYAEDLAEHGVAKKAYPNGFKHYYWRKDGIRNLTAGSDPLLIFCDSMSDMFAANVPSDHVRQILVAMGIAPQHAYQSLTKAAPQILKYLADMPPNLWVGVSSPPDWFMGNRLSRQQQVAMLRKSMDVLHEVKARTGNLVWMSAEPVSWDLTEVIDASHPLDWIVIGAASNGKKYYQPDSEHIRKLLLVMDSTKTPVFFKGNIAPLFETNDLGSVELNRWREDFPRTYRDGTPIPAVLRRDRMCEAHGWPRSRFALPLIDANDGTDQQPNQTYRS